MSHLPWISLRTAAAAVAALILGALAPAAADAVEYPANFEERTIIGGLEDPMQAAWAPDGRVFVIEKEGRLKLAQPGANTATTVLDISNRVNSSSDRGLLGLAVDSSFASNGYIYLLYTYELRPLTADSAGQMVSRLERFTVTGNSVPDAPTVLLGSYVSGVCPAPSNALDCLPSEGTSHSIGTVRSAPDGTLWVGNGDGASFSEVDPLAFRVYNEQSLSGKILHVDREGNGVPGHPFCPGNNLDDACAKVWAGGFRNPFRFKLRPGGGITLGDVGWTRTEEVDLIPTAPGTGGKLYGWPCYEGTPHTDGYEDLPQCGPQYAKEGTANAHIPPAHEYPHVGGGSAVFGGPTYTGSTYPADYRNDIFFADYGQGFIKKLNVNGQGQVTGVDTFATDWGGVDVEITPGGDLAYATGGAIMRIVYTGNPNTNNDPTARFTASPTFGPAPLNVSFNAGGSTDPDGDPLSYDWDFGDGSGSNLAAPAHSYEEPGSYTARLTVSDGRGGSDSITRTISPGNSPPTPRVTGATTYRGGEPFTLQGSATDPQDGNLPATGLDWTVRVIHGTHQHPLGSYDNRAQLNLTGITDHDADSYYQVVLRATDSGNLSTETTWLVRPQTTTLRLKSSPAGAPLSYGGRAVKAPANLVTAIGYRTTITAGAAFQLGSSLFDFTSWSNGGARVQNYTVPAAGGELVATYFQRAGAGGTASPGTPGAPSPPPGGQPQNPGAADTLGPVLQLLGVNPSRGRIRGRASDRSGVRRVSVALRRKLRGGGCSWWLRAKRRMSIDPRPCTKPRWMDARLTSTSAGVRWLLGLGRSLPPGNYRVLVRAIDREGNQRRLPAGPGSIARVARPDGA